MVILEKDKEIRKLRRQLRMRCRQSNRQRRSMTPVSTSTRRCRITQFNNFLQAHKQKHYTQKSKTCNHTQKQKENKNPNLNNKKKTHKRRKSRSCAKPKFRQKSRLQQRENLNSIKKFNTPRIEGFNIIGENINVFNQNISSISLYPSEQKEKTSNLFT